MSFIRLKVQLNNKSSNDSYRKTQVIPIKFVYVLDSPSKITVNDLIRLLEKYIIQQYGLKDIQIVRLITVDGYFLSNDDLCSVVLSDNDGIVCYNMENFIDENYSTLDLKNLWGEIKQYDASDDTEKYIEIGLTNVGKLFIKMHGEYKRDGLYVFSVYQLIKIANEKSQNSLIARLDNQNWYIEAKWEYDLNSSNILFLIYNLKLGSNEHIYSNKLQLLLNESSMSIEKGETISLSGEINDEDILTEKQRERLKELSSKIPSPKRTGPEIDTEIDANKTITKYECEGDSLVQMAYGTTNTITTRQDFRSSKNETFHQHFVITHINFSKKSNNEESSTPVSVANVTVLYQNNDESWCECGDVAIAPISLRLEEPSGWLADSVIHFESDKLVSYAIKGSIEVKGKPGGDNFRRSRMHKSLPQPLKLKIVIRDNLNKQSSLIVEQLNKSLDIDTLATYAKYKKSSINDLLGFIYADDCELDERYFIAIYLDNENHIVINSNHSLSITLEKKYIRSMEFNAKQNNTIEESFDSIYYHYDTIEKKAIGLFDPETFMFYAIRVEISTKTSKTEETIFLPVEKIK